MNHFATSFKSQIHAKATELYGDGLPRIVSDHIEEELEYAAASGADMLMLAVSDAFREAGLDAGDVSIRGAVGNSFWRIFWVSTAESIRCRRITDVRIASIRSSMCRRVSASAWSCRRKFALFAESP